MTRINLLPESFARTRRQARRFRACVALAGMLAVIAGLGLGYNATRLGRLSDELAAAESELSAQRERARVAEARAAEHARLLNVLDRRGEMELPVPAAAVVALLIGHLPDEVTLDRLLVQAPVVEVTSDPAPGAPASSPPTPAGTPARPRPVRIELEGVAMSDMDVAQVVSSLARERLFDNVKLARSRNVELGGHTRFGFHISLDLRVPPADAHAAAATATGARPGQLEATADAR